jgi:hypothetical protein
VPFKEPYFLWIPAEQECLEIELLHNWQETQNWIPNATIMNTNNPISNMMTIEIITQMETLTQLTQKTNQMGYLNKSSLVSKKILLNTRQNRKWKIL